MPLSLLRGMVEPPPQAGGGIRKCVETELSDLLADNPLPYLALLCSVVDLKLKEDLHDIIHNIVLLASGA